MTSRLHLYHLASEHQLTGPDTQALFRQAGFGQEPPQVRAWFWRSVAILGAALGGFGIVLWIAANWDSLGRVGQFSLLQGFFLTMCVGAWRLAPLRVPLSLLALLTIGGLFAYFGQTYQTGADTWQLFALWAALALPLCLGVRSDVLWTPWAIVALTAITLWLQTHTGYRWRIELSDLNITLVAWGMAVLVVAGLGSAARRYGGAGTWSFRTATLGALGLVTVSALDGLLNSTPHYALGTLLVAAGVVFWSQRRFFDIFTLSITALGLNVLLFAGMVKLLLDKHLQEAASILVLGLVAAALLAITVQIIIRLARTYHAQEAA